MKNPRRESSLEARGLCEVEVDGRVYLREIDEAEHDERALDLLARAFVFGDEDTARAFVAECIRPLRKYTKMRGAEVKPRAGHPHYRRALLELAEQARRLRTTLNQDTDLLRHILFTPTMGVPGEPLQLWRTIRDRLPELARLARAAAAAVPSAPGRRPTTTLESIAQPMMTRWLAEHKVEPDMGRIVIALVWETLSMRGVPRDYVPERRRRKRNSRRTDAS